MFINFSSALILLNFSDIFLFVPFLGFGSFDSGKLFKLLSKVELSIYFISSSTISLSI